MQQFIGVKIVQAEPAVEKEVHSGVDRPDMLDQNQRQIQRPGYRVVYPDGYESWSPKAAFEEAYRRTDCMTFGLALEALKRGKKVARKGWNGKNMFLFLTPGSQITVSAGRPLAAAFSAGSTVDYQPHVDMKTAQGSIVPWLCSQTDMLAEDWTIVE